MTLGLCWHFYSDQGAFCNTVIDSSIPLFCLLPYMYRFVCDNVICSMCLLLSCDVHRALCTKPLPVDQCKDFSLDSALVFIICSCARGASISFCLHLPAFSTWSCHRHTTVVVMVHCSSFPCSVSIPWRTQHHAFVSADMTGFLTIKHPHMANFKPGSFLGSHLWNPAGPAPLSVSSDSAALCWHCPCANAIISVSRLNRSQLHQGNYMHFSFGVKDFDLGFRYFLHFSVLLLSIPRTLAFLYLTLAYAWGL
jgi:hypothetical protein